MQSKCGEEMHDLRKLAGHQPKPLHDSFDCVSILYCGVSLFAKLLCILSPTLFFSTANLLWINTTMPKWRNYADVFLVQ